MASTPVSVTKPSSEQEPMPVLWRSLRSEMDRLFDRFTTGLGGGLFTSPRFLDVMSASVPAVDIVEDETAFKLTAELPGLTEKDVDISVSGNTLTVTGEKRQEREEKEKNYYMSERSYGQFRRAFTLPETVEPDKITAEFGKGVLTITLPKSAGTAAKKIDVKAAA